MAWKSFQLKNGRLRLYDGTGTPYFLEVPFRGTLTAPVDRPRPSEEIVLDRGRHTERTHYALGGDAPILAPLPISCSFRLANTEPNYSKFLTLIRNPGNTGTSAPTCPWSTPTCWGRPSSSALRNAPADGTASATHTTPAFIDREKFCLNWEVLWEDPDNGNDRGYQWKEVYIPPDRNITEGEMDAMVDLSGEIYGTVTPITSFTAGTEG